MNSWRAFICKAFGCVDDCEAKLRDCLDEQNELYRQLEDAREAIFQLELLVPGPPPPAIDSIAQRSPKWVGEQLDKLGVIWCQLDGVYYLTNQTNFLNIVAWDWTDSYDYQRDIWDCDKFAVRFKSQVDLHFGLNQVGIVVDYTSGHAYNLIIYPDGNIMLLEPQSDTLFCWTTRITDFYHLKGAIVLL